MKTLWLEITLKRPLLVVVLVVVAMLAAAYGGKNLYFRGDYKVFFEEDNPQRVDFEQMQRVFNKNEGASIVIAPKSGEVFNPETLRLIFELTDAAWQTPYSSRVDSVTNFQHTFAEEDDLIVEDLVLDPDELDSERIQYIQEVALQEPNLVGRLIAESGHVALVNVTVQLPEGDATSEVAEVVEFVRSLSASFKEQYPDYEFYHTGLVLMNFSFADSAQNDAETLIPLMFLVIVLVMWFLLRTLAGTFATVLIIAFTISATMGLSGWMGYFLSSATVNVPVMVMTLAVADCIHVLSSMLYAMRKGMDKEEALRYSMELNLQPIFITSITTAIGFMTLNFAAVPILADLGNLTALGVMLACFLSLTLLPSLMMLLPSKKVQELTDRNQSMERFGEWVIYNRKGLLIASSLVIVVVASFAVNNRLNDVATAYFDKSTEFRQSTDFQQDNVSGMSTIDFAIYSEQESGINNPQVLSLVGEFSSWLRAQPEVDHVATISDTYKRLNKNMHGDNQDYYRLPLEQELAAQYLLLYEMSLPYGLDLNNQLDINKSATRITATLKNLGSNEFTAFEQRAKDWFTERTDSLTIEAGSPTLMFAHIGEANMASLIEGTLIAMVLISGLLIFALRSLRLGIFSLLPNLLPAAIGFGIWAIYSAEINLGLSVVLSMTLGIIVDDTVHFLSKYQRARNAGENAEEAVRFAFSSVARALWITTLVLSIGFLVLTLSSFSLNADMGLLTSIIIVVALAVDFLFLPPFLIAFDNKNPPSEESEDVSSAFQKA